MGAILTEAQEAQASLNLIDVALKAQGLSAVLLQPGGRERFNALIADLLEDGAVWPAPAQ